MTVNISLFAGAGAQFLDGSGNVLTGGKVESYAAGTTTPQATYTTSAGNTAHSNPIILDAAGRVPSGGEIWLDQNLNYKFILRNSADVLIGTYDNIYGAANGLFISNLANTADPTKGDALVGFRQSNSGGNLPNTVGRTVHQKLQEFVSVLDFGADPTGATSSTSAIQAAHDAAVANGFCAVYFPAGTYVITSINWSPYIQAISLGEVNLVTNIASGIAIHISDAYGGAGQAGRNTKTFTGQFKLTNTAVGNTANALWLGGTVANTNTAPFVAIDGLQLGTVGAGFGGTVITIGERSIVPHFQNVWSYGNSGAQIGVLSTAVDTGENIRFDHCIFSGTPDAQAGRLININCSFGVDIVFTSCSFDYLVGLNTPGNTAKNLTVVIQGGHMEANMTAATWLYNDSQSHFYVSGVVVTAPAGAYATPMITYTGPYATTRFTEISYILEGAGYVWHLCDTNSTTVFDYTPDQPFGAGVPTTYVSAAAPVNVGYNGITERQSLFTITAPTSTEIGDGSVAGYYTRIGNRVDLTYKLIKGTSTNFSVSPLGFNLPFLPNTTFIAVGSFWVENVGTGFITGVAKINDSATRLTLFTSAGVEITDATADSWATGSKLAISITYFISL